ncbi:probable transcription factor At3g04930 [Lotus japonicus]|uniref:probable transcription factor At3g04930 n=1 Tax=Lotus japonicus TaxID=34305 RepID=UPI00258953E6|nr:probable transcription factor At3g04930 [Lotus japonicus]
MLSPLVSWILSSSTSSSSSSSSEEEQGSLDTDQSDYENDEQKNNVEDDGNDHFFSSSDVDDDTIPVALAVSHASPAVTVAFPAAAEDRNAAAATTTATMIALPAAAEDRNTAAATSTATMIMTRSKRERSSSSSNKYSAGVRQYQRLWTKQDEMELLKGYHDYIKQQGKATTSLQNVVALLHDHVRPKLNVDFNRNQLVEKLRRLKRKHKVTLDKGKEVQVPFKSSHEQAIFEISHKIWGNDTGNDALDGEELRPYHENHDLVGNDVKGKNEQVEDCDDIEKREPKRLRFVTDDVDTTNEENNDAAATRIQGLIEDTMRSCFSPLMKELLNDSREEPLGAPATPIFPGEEADEQWRRRRILELEVYLDRLELLQGQIKARLEELRSSRG